MVFVAILAGLVSLFYKPALGTSGVSSFDSNGKYLAAKNGVRGQKDWSPQGFGSGEYLESIPKIKAGAVLNLETGEVLWSLNLKERIAPASLSKLATAATAFDIAPLSQVVSVTDDAADQIPTKLGLRQGERLTLEEALKAAILTSANDATEAIAESIGSDLGGGTSTFMNLVNLKLSKIGAGESHFETATGLDNANHYSTVYDLSIIAHDIFKNYPFIKEVASQKYFRLNPDNNHRLIDLPNWNALLGTYPGVNGLKIGYTENAGHVTIVTAQREGKNLMAIVIGASTLENREIGAATLLNYGFSQYGIDPYPVENLNLVDRFEDWRRQLSQRRETEDREIVARVQEAQSTIDDKGKDLAKKPQSPVLETQKVEQISQDVQTIAANLVENKDQLLK